MKPLQEQVHTLYQAAFSRTPQFVVRAPGRVNLIGEHTDYNDGFVFPIALDKAVWLAVSANHKREVNVVAGNYAAEVKSINLAKLEKNNSGWLEYLKGMAYELEAHYQDKLQGFDAAIISDVPIGAGLSSSAALELAFARAFVEVNNLTWQAKTMAQIAQRAENNWVGVQCGIMDQLISAMGKADHAVLIDCRNLECTATPLPKHSTMVVMDTATRRELVSSAYNERRVQCEDASQALDVKVLRDATLEALQKIKNDLEEKVYRRAKHVITECSRTLAAQAAMLQNDNVKLGQLFKQSHQSLAEDFNVTNAALDQIVAIANMHTACYGARMTGAGFGGCAVALVETTQVDYFCQQVKQQYFSAMQLQANIFAVQATAGTAIVC